MTRKNSFAGAVRRQAQKTKTITLAVGARVKSWHRKKAFIWWRGKTRLPVWLRDTSIYIYFKHPSLLVRELNRSSGKRDHLMTWKNSSAGVVTRHIAVFLCRACAFLAVGARENQRKSVSGRSIYWGKNLRRLRKNIVATFRKVLNTSIASVWKKTKHA